MPLTRRRSLRTTIYDKEPVVRQYREYNWDKDLRTASPGGQSSRRRRNETVRGPAPPSPFPDQANGPPTPVKCNLGAGPETDGMFQLPLPAVTRSWSPNTSLSAAEQLLKLSDERLSRQRDINELITQHEQLKRRERQQQIHQKRVHEIARLRYQQLHAAASSRSAQRSRQAPVDNERLLSIDINEGMERLREQLVIATDDEQSSETRGYRSGDGDHASSQSQGSATDNFSTATTGDASSIPDTPRSDADEEHNDGPRTVTDLVREGLQRIEQQTRAQENDVDQIVSQTEDIVSKSPRLRERLARKSVVTPTKSDRSTSTESGHAQDGDGDLHVDLSTAQSTRSPISNDLHELLRTQKIRIVETQVESIPGGDSEGKSNVSDLSASSNLGESTLNSSVQELQIQSAGSNAAEGGFVLRIKAAKSAPSSRRKDKTSESVTTDENLTRSVDLSSDSTRGESRTSDIIFAAASAARVAAEAAAQAAYVSIGTGGFTEESYKKVLDMLALP